MNRLAYINPELARQALLDRYGGAADLEYTARVHVLHFDELWDGHVHVFKFDGSPAARNASVWGEQLAGRLEVHVVPHAQGIVTAADAVRSVALKRT